jgi:dCMP deaminase
MMRPDWDSYFMKIAFLVSERSTCGRAFVGCVLVRDKRILVKYFFKTSPIQFLFG